jgi:threonine efflux protein
MLAILFVILLFVLGALISPGPDFAIVLRYSIVFGRKSGLFCALGVSIGALINSAISFVIGTSLNHQYPVLYLILILCGLSYLFYSGLQLLRNSLIITKNNSGDFDFTSDIVLNTPTSKKSLMAGMLTNVSNVKAIVFFSSLLPLFSKLNLGYQLFAWLSIGLLTFIWFVTVVILFSHHKIRNIFLAKIRFIESIIGCIIMLFAIAIFCNMITQFFA